MAKRPTPLYNPCTMAKVEIYTSALCPYCAAAQRLLQSKGVEFTAHSVDVQPEVRRQMTERAAGRYTVPQIFIDDVGVGGFDEIAALDAEGRLDTALGL